MSLWLQTAKRAANKSASKHHLLRWLMSLGGLGLFVVAIVDSSIIPLPLPGSTDLLLLLLTAHTGTTVITAIWLAFCAFAGSMVGGYLTWQAGCKGGEVTLERYVPNRILGRVKGWVEKYGAGSVALAAILPPPIPLTPFLLAAGALKVSLGRFLVSYGFARMVRYGLLAWLGVTYGRHVVRLWQHELAGWTGIILWIYGGLVLAGICFGIWKFRRGRAAGSEGRAPTQEMA